MWIQLYYYGKGNGRFGIELILSNKGSFENKRNCDMDGFGVYGKTVKGRLYEAD